jgi:RNA polymerase sigma factor (sigma-70 family)
MDQPFSNSLRDPRYRSPDLINGEENIFPLLDRCKRGDRQAQGQLYKMFYGFAIVICLRYTRSREEALEVVNDGFFKIMTNLNLYTNGLSFKGWVRRIMVNASIDHFRRNEKHYNNVDISYSRSVYLIPDIWSTLSEEVILSALQQLPPSYRIVFNLYVIEGYQHDEIAHKLNITVGTSKSNLNVARTKLKKILGLEFEKNTMRNGK